jgi:hypothetical protein
MPHGRERRKRRAPVNRSPRYEPEPFERRLLLAALIAPPDPVIYAGGIGGPLAPRPGHSFYASGLIAPGTALSQWANASAITPNTVNDLVLNVSPSATNYVACCEAAGGTLGANLLTNGITQTQTAPAPSAGQPAVGDGGASDPSNNANVVASGTGQIPFFVYQLGTAGGATPSTNGYDLSEIDVISGHQDQNTDIFDLDVLVEPVGSSQFLSLSGSQGFSLTTVPDGQGGTVYVDKGSSQMAIVSSTPGQPLAQNIQAVKLIAPDPTTFFREFVVTGTPSASAPPAAPLPPSVVAANTLAAGSTVVWPASANAVGYTVLRSTSSNGPYIAVGSVVGQTSFLDATAQPNSTYYYEVTASGNGDSVPSAPSSAALTTNFGATAYIYSSRLWQGTPAIVENLPQINYRGGQETSAFPFEQGFNAETFSAFIDGKITTELAGPYTFVVNTDDDGYLWVNGQLVSGNPGQHLQQGPTTTIPITLAANTAYDFVFLENQRGNDWGSTMSWQEPQSNGQPGPLMVVPSSHLSPAVDAPPMPQQVSAQVVSSNAIQVNWNATGDTSSYGYVIQRAWSDSNGNPTTPFSVVGQIFSGPSTAGAPGSPTWGASTFVDTTAVANTLYDYRVGVIAPNQSTPATWSPAASPVALPQVATASVVNGTLNITEGDANDSIGLWLTSGNQIAVTEGSTAGPISAITIFSTPASTVSALDVSGIFSGTQSLNLMSAFSFSGAVTATQLSDVFVNAPLSAGQVSLVASNNIGINASVTTTGPITFNADSDRDGFGSLSVAASAMVSSGGNPISVHAAALALSGTINSGASGILYSLWPLTSMTGLFSNTITSGTMTVGQATTAAVALSAVVGPSISGTLVLDFPNSTFSTTGLDTSAGSASLQITASSVMTFGAVNTGAGSLALNAGNVTIGAAVNAGSVTIPAYANVAVDGATMTVAGNITNAGSLVVGAGGIVTCGGALTGGGSAIVGLPAGSGSVAYYRFEGTPAAAATGTGTIVDSSGNGLNGTAISGPIYSANVPINTVPQTGDPDATSLSFDGTSQRVFISDNPLFELTQSLTLEAWVYAEPLTTGNTDGNIIFRGDSRAGLDPYWLRFIGVNSIGFNITNAGGQSAGVGATIPVGQWVHVAGTLDGSTGAMRLYVNGTLVSSTTTAIRPYDVLTGPNPGLGIGALQDGRFEYFHGSIDEARISNVALTPSQLLDAPQRPPGAAMTVGSFSQQAVSIGPTGELSVAHSASPVVNTTNALNIPSGGKLELANNGLTINYAGQTDPIATIRSYLASGYSNGAWNGTGIVSSTAATNPNHNTAIGYADSSDGQGVNTMPNTIELKYTLVGDANLDGQVNSADLQILLAGLNRSGSWDQGDFNYDGQVNSADLQALLFTLNTSLGSQAMPVGVAAVAAGAGATAPVAAVSHSPVRQGIPTSSITPAAPLTHHPRPAKPHAKRR